MTRELRRRVLPLVLGPRPYCARATTPATHHEAFTQVLLGRDLEVRRGQEREHKGGWEWLQHSVTLARQGHGSAAARTLSTSLYRSTDFFFQAEDGIRVA